MVPLPRAGNLTLLVVDDDAMVLHVIVRMLSRANFTVLSATSGVDALEMASQTAGAIDLLLSDVDMPVMSGPELVAAFRRVRPETATMLMSGGNAKNLLLTDADCSYISKPFVPLALVNKVTAALAGRSPMGAAY